MRPDTGVPDTAESDTHRGRGVGGNEGCFGEGGEGVNNECEDGV